MPTQEYELTEPIYPIKEIVTEYEKHNKEYDVKAKSRQPYDTIFEEWWKTCVVPGTIDKSLKKPILRTINKIKRIKVGKKEYVTYHEYLIGQDYQQNPLPFTHNVGYYTIPVFRRSFDYATNEVVSTKGGKKLVYVLEYSPKLIRELLEYAPDGPKTVELLVEVGSAKYGFRGFFTEEEFINDPIEELAKKGRDGKQMFLVKESRVEQTPTEQIKTVRAIEEPKQTKTTRKPKSEKVYDKVEVESIGNLET